MRKGPLALVLLFAVAASFLAGTWVAHRSASKAGGSGGRKILHYVCPMHPGFTLDHPGDCGTCGMPLEPVYADGSTGGGSSPGTPGTVTLPPGEAAVRRGGGREGGESALDRHPEAHRQGGARRRPHVPGQHGVRRLVAQGVPPTTGSFVRKDEPLAAYFTSGYLAAANAYLFALDTRHRHQQSGDVSQAQVQNMDYQMRTAVGNLINIGVSESQIREMEKTGKASELVEIRSPADGFVLARSVTEGQFVSAGSELYRIADLGKVWILAETYESEGNLLRPGMEVMATHPQTKRTYRAQGDRDPPPVRPADPHDEGAARGGQPRLRRSAPTCSSTWRSRSGCHRRSPFPSRRSSTPGPGRPSSSTAGRGSSSRARSKPGGGWATGSRSSKGLTEGEKIVVSGNFLIDSESRMQLAAAGIYGAWHVDPVCAMHVDEGKAKAAGKTVDHGGMTYYFCSDDCVAKFRKDPAKYVKGAAPKAETARESDGLPVDPVCGMVVDPMTARAANRVGEHKGKTPTTSARTSARRGSTRTRPDTRGSRAGLSWPERSRRQTRQEWKGVRHDTLATGESSPPTIE